MASTESKCCKTATDIAGNSIDGDGNGTGGGTGGGGGGTGGDLNPPDELPEDTKDGDGTTDDPSQGGGVGGGEGESPADKDEESAGGTTTGKDETGESGGKSTNFLLDYFQSNNPNGKSESDADQHRSGRPSQPNPFNDSNSFIASPYVATNYNASWTTDKPNLLRELDTIQEQVHDDIKQLTFTTHAVTSAGVVLTVGYTAWTIHTAHLAAAMFSSLPVWHSFDPLPVLSSADALSSIDEQNDESLVSIIERGR
jgi:hypothetical protein